MGGIMEFQVYNSDVRLFGVILADPPTYTLKSDIIYARAHEQKQFCHIHYLFEYVFYLPSARHHNPWLVYFLPHFSVRLIFQTIYLTNIGGGRYFW